MEYSIEERRGAKDGGEFKGIRRGWCLGGDSFRQDLLDQMSAQMGAEHYGQERAEAERSKAERIIAQELKRRKWAATELNARLHGDPAKVDLAVRLRRETTMTVGGIAERLSKRTRGYLNHLLYLHRKSDEE